MVATVESLLVHVGLMPRTDEGVYVSPVVPLPSSPYVFMPQHCTTPPRSTAQLSLLPAVIAATFKDNLEARRELVVLVKPQFEVGREQVGKGGIVRSAEAQQSAVEKLKAAVAALGGREIEVIDSPILGGEGNKEFLACLRATSA